MCISIRRVQPHRSLWLRTEINNLAYGFMLDHAHYGEGLAGDAKAALGMLLTDSGRGFERRRRRMGAEGAEEEWSRVEGVGEGVAYGSMGNPNVLYCRVLEIHATIPTNRERYRHPITACFVRWMDSTAPASCSSPKRGRKAIRTGLI